MSVCIWHPQHSYDFHPTTGKSTTKKLEKLIMYAGAFSVVLYPRNNKEDRPDCEWEISMTFGGATEKIDVLGVNSKNGGVARAKKEAAREFKNWIASMVMYAPHALAQLEQKCSACSITFE